MTSSGKVGFCIGTGRCGTLFLYQLLDLEPAVASSHERNPDNEAFHRYCKWHGLPVDDEGFLATKEDEINADLKSHEYSFEASPYLSLSARELHKRFDARFVLLIRRPDRVVTSFVHKGFYRRPFRVSNIDLATGYQPTGRDKGFTFFARIAPRGEFFHRWNEMTQVGRVSWFWRAWNERTLELLNELPAQNYRIVRIEDLNYAKYVELGNFLGYQPQVSEERFDELSVSKPHAFWSKRNIDHWSPVEVEEFESQVSSLASRFNYEYRVANMIDEAKSERSEAEKLGHIQPKKEQKMWRVRRGAANWLNLAARYVDVD